MLGLWELAVPMTKTDLLGNQYLLSLRSPLRTDRMTFKYLQGDQGTFVFSTGMLKNQTKPQKQTLPKHRALPKNQSRRQIHINYNMLCVLSKDYLVEYLHWMFHGL